MNSAKYRQKPLAPAPPRPKRRARRGERLQALREYMERKGLTIDEIREHFRRETSKLDRWIWYGRIEDYFKAHDEIHEERRRRLRRLREEYAEKTG